MTTLRKYWRAAAVATALALTAASGPAFAHGGEDHGEKSAPQAVAPAAAQSAGYGAEGSAYQAVLIPGKDGKSILYLADIDTNQPIAQAKVEAEADGWTGQAQATASPGIYAIAWAPPSNAAADVTLMIETADKSDLILISGIVLAAQPALAKAESRLSANWPLWAGGGGGALLLAALLHRRSSRRTKTAMTVIVVMLLPVLLAQPVLAHGGEDHGDQGHPAESQAAPIPGTAISMPKAAQFVLGIRTMRIEARQAAETVRLVGKVVPDPAGYARVQPVQAARVAADPNFPLPVPGQKVKKGQVVAVLEPNLSSIERSDKRASLYKVESEIAVLERQLARWQQAPGIVAPKEIETARIQLEQLRKEKTQVTGTALGRDLVTAPIDGVVTDMHVVPGQMVTSDTVLVEIVDLAKLRVEAVLYDLSMADRITGASAATQLLPDGQVKLSLLGVSPRIDPQDQGVHLHFSVADGARRLKLGMPVDVFAETGATRLQTAVPRDAVTEMSGRSVVFVRTAPERFEMRQVKVERMVGHWAEIGEGIAAGDKVVLQGAAQLKAVR